MQGLSWKEALAAMKEGKKVKQMFWDKGYWIIEDGTLLLCSGDGEVMDIRKHPSIINALNYTTMSGWEIVE